jgi:hypothetical protein
MTIFLDKDRTMDNVQKHNICKDVCTKMCVVFVAAPMMKAKALPLSDFQLVTEPVCGRLTAEAHLALMNSEVGVISF